ncbi:hypothetical protein KAR91_62820 [Candidatus Pacearchaeota archaeon]|nr:hypothetical protein [Candidatus Pacearchaeota archaeon]
MAATRGKARVKALGFSAGLAEGNRDGASWDFIYQVSTVKHPEWNVGDRVQLPDGRVFYYAKSAGICYTGQGNCFQNAIPATGIDYVVLTENAPVGQVYVKTTATLDHTIDDLRNGHMLLKPTNTSTNAVLQMRLVTGNTACSAGDEITIYLDGGLTAALTTLSYVVVMPSPWNAIKLDGSLATSVAGIAATYVDATDKYFWIQTWGQCWIAPQTDLGQADSKRQLVFRHDGSVGPHDDSDTTYEEYAQHAGFVLDDNSLANGATKMMLQITP